MRLQGALIEDRILLLRGHRVMLSPHLAELYEVETKALVQAVKRNIERFPSDFLFQLTWEETHGLQTRLGSLRSQIVTLKRGRHIKHLPYAFTEQGVAMLSSVLRSPRAVQVNIEIVRAFVRLRHMLSTHADLARKLRALERKCDSRFRMVFEAIRELMEPAEPPRKRIGFHSKEASSRSCPT